MQITNDTGVPLALAVWLVHDDYDYVKEDNYVSVTRLMRPIRQLVLPTRIPMEDRSLDVSELAARAYGNAVHDSVEKAWTKGYRTNLRKLGYPNAIIERVLINPEHSDLKPDSIPVYIEQRAIRQITVRGITFAIGGKFDMVTEGIVNDTKSTSVWNWIKGTRDEEHSLQGSLYRWIDAGQEHQKITQDIMQINYVFTDWQKNQSQTNPKYPDSRTKSKTIPLLGLLETEEWIIGKLIEYLDNKDKPESQMAECTDEDLWRSDPQFKFFLDPSKADQPGARATKNFDNILEAQNYKLNEKGGRGIVKTVPGEVKRCGYCDAFPICEQRKRYFPE